jgi:hypothetical protein
VRDHLSADEQVYLEVASGPWNGGYAVTEASPAGLARPDSPRDRAGNSTRGRLRSMSNQSIVASASFEHVSPYFSDLLLDYMTLSRSMDAMATALDFGYEAIR